MTYNFDLDNLELDDTESSFDFSDDTDKYDPLNALYNLDNFAEIKYEPKKKPDKKSPKKPQKPKVKLKTLILIAVAVILAISVIVGAATSGDDVQQETVAVVPTSAPTQPPTEPEPTIPQAIEASSNDLLDIIVESGSDHIAYLTFDDGPNDTITPQILDILKQYNIKATFFEIGYLIESFPEMTKRVVDEGHFVANHSYSHDFDSVYASSESFINEIERTYDLISAYYPKENPPMKLIRFPGGSFEGDAYGAIKSECKQALKYDNFYYVDWNCLNGDADGTGKNADELYNYTIETISTNNIVILMHDTVTKEDTVTALPRILDYLIENGWEFRTLDNIPYKVNTADSQTE